jgi:hypothetical protein
LSAITIHFNFDFATTALKILYPKTTALLTIYKITFMRKYLVLLVVCSYSFVSNAQNVGVGVPNPQNKLHVGGGFRLDTLTGVGGAGLLWHNPNGVVYGIKFSGNTNEVLRGDGTFGPYNPAINGALGWLLTGNSGTNPASNFLGTTDDQPLLFRVNNIRHGYLGRSIFFGSNAGLFNTDNGNIAIGSGSLGKNVSSIGLVAVGDSALFNNTGVSNTAVGYRTLFSNTTGHSNTALGNLALGNNNGTANTAVGNWALLSNTTGTRNTAVGNEALSRNVLGNDNTAVGYNALFQNIGAGNSQEPVPFRGVKNTAVGSSALYANITGSNNSAYGANAMSLGNGSQSSAFGAFALQKNASLSSNAFGYEALQNNTTGNYNSGFGSYTLYSNTTGYANTAIGIASLESNNGYYNSALGAYSLNKNTGGHDNTALGYSALFSNETASFNTSVGAFSLYNNTSGTENVAVGYKAMEQNLAGRFNCAFGIAALNNSTTWWNSAFGAGALKSTTSGYANTAVGNDALGRNVNGTSNTAVGDIAGYQLPTNVSNVTCLGAGTGWNTTSSNQVNIGDFSVTWIGGQTGWFHYSDKRIKKDIKDDVPGLSFITRLKPITYNVDVRKQEEIANAGNIEVNSELIKPVKKDWEGKYDVEKIKMTGFFAQDVEEAARAINYSFNGVHNPKNGGLLSLDYSAFVVPLVKAVQEQQSIIEKQQKLIDELLKRVTALENK